MRRWFLVGLVLLIASPAAAGVPSPANSTVPCIIMCPQGDIPLEIVVRDLANNPLANVYVRVDFCEDHLVTPGSASIQDGPPFAFCCDFSCGAAGYTDANGRFVFALTGGGASALVPTCGIVADGVSLGGRISYSPDQNGDLVVDVADVALATALLGTSNPNMDLDCDGGLVDADDLAALSLHQGHMCHCPVPTRRNSWGQMKTLYR